MKKYIMLVLMLVVPTFAYAERYCQWDGSKGYNCQTDDKGFIRLDSGLKIRGVSAYNSYGYYRLTDTEPVYDPETQSRDQEVWGFTSPEMTLTYTVRDLTEEELNEIAAQPMSVEMYQHNKWLANEGVTNPSTMPQWMRDAYQARVALENP